MKSIALTGGVACGKGVVGRYLLEAAADRGLDVDRFDCDSAVATLWDDRVVLEKLREIGGEGLFSHEGVLDKSALREKLFADRDFRSMIESVLHPLVLEGAGHFTKERSDAMDVLLFEVPLLYEVDFPLDRDFTVVVGASVVTQCQRMVEKRNLPEAVAENVIASQLSTEVKVRKGDFVIWNDGSLEALSTQVESLAERIF